MTDDPRRILRDARVAVRHAEDVMNRVAGLQAEHRSDTDVAALLDAVDQARRAFDALDGHMTATGVAPPAWGGSEDAPPVLPLEVRAGVADVTLAVSLSDVVFAGDDERPEGLTLGHLVAARIADRATADLGGLRDEAGRILDDALRARAAELLAAVLSRKASDWRNATRGDLTLAAMVEAHVHQQLHAEGGPSMARGRAGVPVVEAVIATAVTEALRDLAAAEVAQIRAKILADIATSGGRR